MGVRSGYLAAKAADAGYVGDPGLLDRDWLAHSHGVALDLNRLFDGLGKGRSIYRELSMKPFSSAKQAVAAIEALRSILAEGVAPESIHAVTVRVPKAYVGMIEGAGDAKNRATTFASVRFQMALALFHPASLFDVARDKLPWDERMAAFVGKVKVEVADELASYYPARWPASVVVDAEGSLITRTMLDSPGDPVCPLSEASLVDKGHRVLDPMIGTDACTGWLDAATAGWDKGLHDPAATRLSGLLTSV
jgi:2-methylcitrate dehydratase PrpD